MALAQSILDCFPDSVSQFGLIGCALFILSYVAAALLGVALRNLSR